VGRLGYYALTWIRQAPRRPIPTDLRAELLFRSEHTCCICRNPYKDVQLHHIDGNPVNNILENVAVVCLDCHSRVTGTRGLGQSYSRHEVRKYKRSWEYVVLQKRGMRTRSQPPSRETLGYLDFVVCEILATKSTGRAEELLDVIGNFASGVAVRRLRSA